MHLLNHVAQHHYKDQSEKQEEQYKGHPEDDAILNDAEGNQNKRHLVLSFMSPCWMSSCEEDDGEN